MTKEERQRTIWNRQAHPDRSITQCFWDAKRTIHFRKTMKEDIAAHKRRSIAAKKAWKNRKANARVA